MTKIPTNSVSLLHSLYSKIFPAVKEELQYWTKRANEIPNKELRKQALASIKTKEFHCEGGSVYALFGKNHWRDCVKFIVAYQTISDYLDNLCDRSTSLDPTDFRQLHYAMTDGLRKESVKTNYYAYREEQNDGGYLTELVLTCQSVIRKIPQYSLINEYVKSLATNYSDLQIYKHVQKSEREELLKEWYKKFSVEHKDLEWYEFAACTGSTIGIFCLISYSFSIDFLESKAKEMYELYFPYFQGLHILLDYFIDEEEDNLEGDLNFVTYYDNKAIACDRLSYFSNKIKNKIINSNIDYLHQWIFSGLFGVYLSDPKMRKNPNVKLLLKNGGRHAQFFYYNRKCYEAVKSLVRNKQSLA